MKVAHTLGLGFAGLLTVFAASGAFVISSLHSSVSQFNVDEEVATQAFDYERGALREQAGAYMTVERSAEMGRQNLVEGRLAMAAARERLDVILKGEADRAAVHEMARVERLVSSATDDSTFCCTLCTVRSDCLAIAWVRELSVAVWSMSV